MNQRSISFPNWKEVLAGGPLSPQLKAAYTREILTFLKHCKSGHAAATNEVARSYLEWREKQSSGPAREALRWFYREGSRHPTGSDTTSGRDVSEPVTPATT